MLDYDYEADLLAILQVVPKTRQTTIWSATMTTKVERLQKASLKDPERVEAHAQYSTVSTLTQQYVFIPLALKRVYLVHVLNLLAPKGYNTLVFCEACHLARKLCLILRKLGHRALPLYGQMTQDRRELSLGKFRTGNIKILVCTDVASRGLDIDLVDCVINFSLPLSVKDYIHRVGRTARAGRSGTAISFVTQYDVLQFQKIEKLIGLKMEEFPVDSTEAESIQERVGEAEKAATWEIKEELAKTGEDFSKKKKKKPGKEKTNSSSSQPKKKKKAK
eukprot:NODE_5630_length_990_cov_33.333333_g5053_i0.p1 GENE.NODE_5630_length_990_cov_33.333333_g5053_i0~~NODE_5630_length_990_cov_33.333333_g5053_i0.p1  ORF type:complete len:277 (-),score=58.60 NODE_5630_length_990_cov_33.333333_g5053_i0:33-863(-)